MPNIPKTGGGTSPAASGGYFEESEPAQPQPFNPDQWVVSVFRTLKSYVESAVDSDLYEIVFGFPSAEDIGRWLPFEKTLIHLEIDDMTHLPLGFGDNIVDTEYNEAEQSLVSSEAQVHIINWDVGIWASASTGGVTARLEAYQVLNDLFVGPTAYNNLRALGVEIRSFAGGAFIKEEQDNISIFRVINMTLVTRVYSRRLIGPTPTITGIAVAPPVSAVGEPEIIIREE